MGSRGRWSAAALSALIAMSVLAVSPVAVAQEEPVFHLPFTCGETWTASTRTGHSPDIDAVDFNRPSDAGAAVLAGADGGTVSAVGDESGYGDYVKVAYPGGVELLFAHLASVSVAEGAPVNAQTQIGTVGATGLSDSRAHHLHYEQRVDGDHRPVVIEGQPWVVGVHVADDKDDLATNPGIAHPSQNCSGSGTAENPSGTPVSRPTSLPARAPWSDGQAHKVIASYDGDSPEGFGLLFEIASPDTVYPVYPGEVIYAGCATGRSAPLGRTVVVRRTIGERTFDAVYGHLVSIDGALSGASILTPRQLGANQPLGTVGSLTGSSLDDCPGSTATDRLYVGILRDATVSPAGEISGGQPVYAEPLVGHGAYEGFTWWSGPATATEVEDGIGEPWGRWAKASEKDGAVITFGDTITLSAEVKDSVPLKELRFTAYYKGWPKANSADRLDGFSETKTWRILAVCRPPGVNGEPAKTKGCRWDGSATDAVVTYEWDPTLPVNAKVTPWQPLTTVAISEKADACVPVTLSFDLFDQAGYRRQAPGGVKRANKCPQDVASSGTSFVLAQRDEPDADRISDAEKKTAQQDRYAYLMPPQPPAAPGNVRMECWKDPSVYGEDRERTPGQFGTHCLIDLGGDASTIHWKDRSDNEDGFHIYARLAGFTMSGQRCERTFQKAATEWVEVATLRPGARSWRADRAYLDRRGPIGRIVRPAGFSTLGVDFMVTSFNAVDDSQPVGGVFIQTPNPFDIGPCQREPGATREWRRQADFYEGFMDGER